MQCADKSIFWLVNSCKPKQLPIVSTHQFKSPPTHLLTNLSTHNLTPPQLTDSKNNTNLSAHNLIKSQTQKISNSELKLLSLILQKHSGFNSVLAKISAKK